MATEEYIVSLGALIDESAVESINTQIKTMQPKLDKVRISIDEMYFNKQLTNIQNQLNRLFKDSDFGKYLSSNLKTVSQEISKTVNDTERQAKRLTDTLRTGFVKYAGLSDGTKDNTLIDETKIQKAAQTYFNEINQIGNVTTKVFRNADSEIESFTIDVKNAEGIIEQLRYTLHTIEDEEGNITNAWYAFSNAVGSDNNIKLQEQAMREAEKASKALQTQIDRNTAAVTNYNNELEITKRKYLDPNASKPITNSDSLDTLQGQYDKVTTAINALGNADKTNFTSLKANVEAEIALLKQMATEFRNAEYAANQLAAKPITVIKENEEQNIKKLKADIQAAKIESQDFLDKVNALSGQLAGVTNKQQLGEYLNTFSTIKAEFQALSSEQKAQEKQARDINNAYKSFESTINKIAKLEAQVAGLDPVKNAGQITELKNKINELYTEASKKQNEYYNTAKKGGIEVATIINNMDTAWGKVGQTVDTVKAKTQDMQRSLYTSVKDNISNGNLGTSVDTIEAKFRSLNVQSTEVEGNITQLKTLLSQMDASDDIENVTADYEQYKTLLVTVTNQIKTLQIAQKQANEEMNLSNAKASLSSSIDVWLKNNSAAAKQFGAELQNIKSQIESADKTQLGNLKAQFQEVTRQAAIAGQTGKTMAEQFKQSLRTVTSYFSAATLVTRMVSTIRNMYNEVLKVDTAMTGLKRVTNLTSDEYENLYDRMTKSAKEYGSTLDDIINSTASWVRLGFDSNVAEKLSEVTATYQHVTDLDNSTAVNNLVTAYKGYQEQLLELNNNDSVKAMTQIADVYDKLGNEMPVTAAQVGEGMTKAAAVLEQSGAKFTEAAGMITGGGAVTQDFDAFGNALKISALRIRSMKGSLEELGEEVDDSISSVSKVQTQILNLTHGKVNIFEDNGVDYKSITEIYREISNVYKELSSTEQSSLLELIAGKNRANQIQGLVTHWDDVEKAITKASNAEGTAAAENKKHMNSMQGKIDSTKASWQALSNTLLSSDFLKGLIDSGQTLLDIINGISNTIFGLPTAISTVVAVMSIKNKDFGRDKMYSPNSSNMPKVVIVLFGYRQFRYYQC